MIQLHGSQNWSTLVYTANRNLFQLKRQLSNKIVETHGRTEWLVNWIHYMNQNTCFRNICNFRNTLRDFIKHVRLLLMCTHDTLQARIESILA